MHIAPRTTLVAAGTTAERIGNLGDNLTVFGLVVEGVSAAGQVVVLNEDETTKFTVSTVTTGSTVMDIPFYADAGLKITTPANVTCTVFHSHPGR